MSQFRTVRIALPFAAPLAAVLSLPVALALAMGDARAAGAPAETAAEVFSITVSSPGVSHALDGDVVTLFGNVDDRIEKRRLVTALESVEGVARVIDIVRAD